MAQLQKTLLTKAQLTDHEARADALRKVGRSIITGYARNDMVLFWDRNYPGLPRQAGDMFKMADGSLSPIYLTLRALPSVEADPRLYDVHVPRAAQLILREIGALDEKGRPVPKTKVIGLAMAGIPLVDAIRLTTGIPALYTRKLPDDVKTEEDVEKYLKAHGAHALVEGIIKDGDRIILWDDLVTKFKSKLLGGGQAKQEVLRRGLKNVTIEDVCVLVDREQGGTAEAVQHGYKLHAVVPFRSKGLGWLEQTGTITSLESRITREYFENPTSFQTPEKIAELRQMAIDAHRSEPAEPRQVAPADEPRAVAPVTPQA